MKRLLAFIAVAAMTLAFSLLPLTGAHAADYANPQLLISSAELSGILSRSDVRVIDVRPRADYDKGHIAGSVNIPADAVNEPNGFVPGVRLSDDKLAQLFGGNGVGRDTQVVLYDDKGGFHAARIFWMLEYLGHRKVGILNGGIQKWTRDGHPLTADVPVARTAQFTPTLAERRLATADWLLEHQSDPEVVVIDVRPRASFDKGHIPWARSIPWAQNLTADGTMKSADDLLAHFHAHGVTLEKNIATHCQDGKASGQTYFTLRLLGFKRLRSYDRSWAEWGAADDLPKTVSAPRG